MRDFPEFMKNKSNHISSKEQNYRISKTIFYADADCSQMAFWTVIG